MFLTEIGKAKLATCADSVPWKGRPQAGSVYAHAKLLGVSTATLNRIVNGMNIGEKVAAQLIEHLGPECVSVDGD